MSGKTNGSFIRSVAYSEAVEPSDSVDLPGGLTRAVLVAESGIVSVTYANGVTDNPYLLAGVWHPMQVKRVRSTGTAATGIKAGY